MKKSFFSFLLASLITFSFFIPQILKGKIPIPADSIIALYHPFRDIELDNYNKNKFPAKNPFINDPVLQTFEWRNLVIKNIKDGNLPLWNPYSFAGQPLLANFQSAVFQITNVLFLFLPFKLGWAISIILPPVLLSVFMYLFLRELKISKKASVFGAFVLPFSGFFMPWLTWGTIVTTAMWLPLILLSILKLESKQTATWFLILTISSALSIFSGHAQTALYVISTAMIFILYQYCLNRKLKSTLLSLVAITGGILISAVQLLPFLEFLNLSARGIDQGYYIGREDWFLPPKNLIQLIVPDFFGNPATNNYWGVWNYWEFVAFIGIIPFAFAIYSFFKKNHSKLFFIILAVISLFLALPNPISKIPYNLNIPLVSSLQPSRIIFVLVFSLVTLSAIGLDGYLKEKKGKFILVPTIFFLVIVSLALSTLIFKNLFPSPTYLNVAQRNLFIPLAVCLALILISQLKVFRNGTFLILTLIYAVTIYDLFRFSYKFTPFSKPSWIFPQTEITKYLENQPRPFRIITTDRRLMHPNISSVYGIESVDGYDPIYLESYAKLVSAWKGNDPKEQTPSFNRIITPQVIDSPITNLINVKYLLSFDEIKSPDFIKVLEEGETKLYLNTKALPRAFFASEVKKVNNENEEVATLIDKTTDPRIITSQTFYFQKQKINATANIENYTDQSISIKTNSNKTAPLIVTNPFYPGWNAYIDGKKTNIQKVDFMFQSIIVSEGEHLVKFKFEPKSFYNGLIISAIGLILTIITAQIIWKRKFQ